MVGKAPNPNLYWAAQADVLAQQDSRMYREVLDFRFNLHDGFSLSYSRDLGKRLLATLGNQYNYAASTYLTGMSAAVKARTRKLKSAKS